MRNPRSAPRRVKRLSARRSTPLQRPIVGAGNHLDLKQDLVANLSDVSSLRDFGGCYIVEGRYLLEPAQAIGAKFVSMVDHGDTSAYQARAEEAALLLPDTRFETVNADFRHAATFTGLEPVDASILFEVLMHQENYSEVVRNVTSTSNKFVCVAQPCLREEWFPLPSSSTLLQFWDEELKDEIRRDSFWPEEERATTFTSGSWMWGHTTSHLIDLFGGYGWSLEHGEVISNVCGVHWEYPLLVFRSPA